MLGILFLLAGIGLYCGMQDEPEPEVEAPVAQNTPPPTPTTMAFGETVELPPMEELVPEEPEEPEMTEEATMSVMRAGRMRRECNGEISSGTLRTFFARVQPQVRSCYERQLRTNNMLQGRVSLRVTIEENGSPASVNVGGSLRDRDVFACVRRAAQGWDYPRPTGGCAVVSQPFNLTPRN